MTKAKCFKCGGSAIANTYEQARKLINHAVGLSRGIKCGDSYNMVQEINSPKTETPKPTQTPPKPTETRVIAKEIPKPETPKPVVTNTTKSISTTSKKTETTKETKKQTKSSV